MTKKQLDLSKYVSNLDRNVYAIYQLPEEVIAVIFAYVSRSSLSFRDNLAKLLEDNELAVDHQTSSLTTSYSEKAAQFHEKWVVGYGHSSVAEHAVAHIGVEKISRLASAELELANSFNSFTEYSQRYQRPQRGDTYIPVELDDHPLLKKEYIKANEHAYNTYETCMEGLLSYLPKTIKKSEKESDRAYQLRLEKVAFEDARYVLPLSTLTNLGMTGNGRALRDTLVRLYSSPNKEVQKLAEDLEREVETVIPTLLKYVKANDYFVTTQNRLKERWKDIEPKSQVELHHTARFLHMPVYIDALRDLVKSLVISVQSLSYEEADHYVQSLSEQELEQIVDESLSNLRFFDHPLDQLQHITYTFECKVSEANWHQLLRHNRRTHFSYGSPTIQLGYILPPHIQEAGLAEVYHASIKESEQSYLQLHEFDPNLAAYLVTNAHHRQIIGTSSLWELYHLINLRTSPEAQWDIRETFTQLFEELSSAHPVLAKYAQRRL